jgi:hypothetical protein
MRFRSALAAAAAALALAPAAAHAQGAGDDQYADPFGGEDSAQATPAPRKTPAPTATPAAVAPAPASTPAPAQPARTKAQPQPPTLPYTGVDAWPLALSGALLLGSGLALRARLRSGEHD